MYTELKIAQKGFCESLREYVMKIINFETKKMIPLTKQQQESYQKFEHKYTNDRSYCKVKDHCYYTFKCRRII